MRHTYLLGAALAFSFAGGAAAELIELENGGVLQGKVLEGKSTDDALAVQLFDTGGELMVKWDHVMAARRKQLREDLGIDIPEEEQVLIAGHRVEFSGSGTGDEFKIGIVLNPESRDQPPGLQLKTRTGVATYDWSNVGAVEPMEIDGLLAYKREELYQLKLDETLPETPKAHFDMAVLAQKIGMFEKAKEHLDIASTDADFLSTGDGRSIAQRKKSLDVLIRARGASDMVEGIKRLKSQNKWNEARDLLKALSDEYKDEAIRKAIRFSRVETQTLKGRDKYFRRRVQQVLHSQLGKLCLAKAREKQPREIDPDQRGGAIPGTIAAAKRWAARELPQELWGRVGEICGLEVEEVDKFWKERASKKVHSATYGTGSFIVMKKAKKSGDRRKTRRPPPGSRRRGDSKGGPSKKKAAKPKTEQEWWATVRPGDRAKWLGAYFVETSGLFHVLRADEDDDCSNCGGLGIIKMSSTSGAGADSTFCTRCNGSGHFRRVKYR